MSGHDLRKERRKEERKNAKKRTIALVPNFVGHDSVTRTSKRKMCLFIAGLERQVEKEEAHLRHSNKKPPAKPKASGLKGAARPAWEKYPELYPEMHVVEVEEPAIDLLAQYSPLCFAHPETRNLVSFYYQLGYAHLLQQELSLARKAFNKAIELDETDQLDCKHGLLFACNQPKALESLHPAAACKRDLAALFHLAVVHKTEKHVEQAVEACPEIALALHHHHVFAKMIDTEQVVGWVREERSKHLVNAVETGVVKGLPLGRFDAGVCQAGAPQALAVCYFALYSHLWVKDVKLMAWLSAVVREMEVVGEDGGGEGEEEEEDSDNDEEEEDSDKPVEVQLVEMFEEAFAKVTT